MEVNEKYWQRVRPKHVGKIKVIDCNIIFYSTAMMKNHFNHIQGTQPIKGIPDGYTQIFLTILSGSSLYSA